jgi:hypothetical protein
VFAMWGGESLVHGSGDTGLGLTSGGSGTGGAERRPTVKGQVKTSQDSQDKACDEAL